MRVLGLVILVPGLVLVVLCADSVLRTSNEQAFASAVLLLFFAFWAIVGAALVFLGTRKGWFCKACGTSVTEQSMVCPTCHAEFDLPS